MVHANRSTAGGKPDVLDYESLLIPSIPPTFPQLLASHEGPISNVSFSPFQAILASSSWDKTLRLWDVFEHKGNTDRLIHTSDGEWGHEGGGDSIRGRG